MVVVVVGVGVRVQDRGRGGGRAPKSLGHHPVKQQVRRVCVCVCARTRAHLKGSLMRRTLLGSSYFFTFSLVAWMGRVCGG